MKIDSHFALLQWIVACFFLGQSLAFAEESQPATKVPPPEMPVFLHTIEKLQPYMISERAFSDPKNEKSIQEELNRLRDLSKSLPHDSRISKPLMKKAAARIQAHFENLALSYSLSKTYSRYLLRSTLSGCSSCHAQIASEKAPLIHFEPKNLVGSHFEKAEFLMTVRQFDDALKLYELALKFGSADNRRRSLNQGLAIFLRYRRDLKGAEAWLESFPANTDDEKAKKASFQKQIADLKKQKLLDPKIASLNEITSYAEKSLDANLPEEVLSRLYASGLVHDYLDAEENGEDPKLAEIYYWVGKADSTLQLWNIFSLTPDYFEECIKISKSKEMGKKCFDEFESATVMPYTGSSGVHLPDPENKLLNSYRKQLGLPKKEYSTSED